MNAAAGSAGAAVPRGLVATLLLLLVLPFDPHWLDFEQARRGLLLLLASVALVVARPLRAVAGERWLWALVGALLVSAGVAWFGDRNELRTFQPWDAIHRVAHWLALLVVLRLGAAGARTGAFAVLLLSTSAFGVLQRLGVAEIAGYGVAHEPVSVFGNLNVAAEWTAVAAAVVAVQLPSFAGRARPLAIAALLLAGAYAAINGSRSAVVALPIGLGLLAGLRWRANGWLPAALVVVGFGAGKVVAALGPAPDAVAPPSTTATARDSNTIDVRLEIARSTLRLVGDDPVLGLGPGQFAVHYPRVRSEREIELSSHGRQFPTEVRTVHDDWLELLVDGGAVALVLFLLFVLALVRAQPDRARLVPLAVLLLLMIVRAPLWNAPAAVAAFWLAGTSLPPANERRVAWPAIVVALLLAALGASILLGNAFAARYQATHLATTRDVASLQRAAWWLTGEPRFLQLLTQERLFARDLDGAARAAAKALQLRPHDPQLHLHLGEVLANARKYTEAAAVARAGLAIDPPHPELRVLLSTALAQAGDVDGAIAAVADRPHPVLRASLARHFQALAGLAQRGTARYLLEHHVVAAIDALADRTPAGLTAASEHVREALQAALTAERRQDARPLLLAALQLLATDPAQVATLGARTVDRLPLTDAQRELFGDRLEPLRTIPGFREFLAKR